MRSQSERSQNWGRAAARAVVALALALSALVPVSLGSAASATSPQGTFVSLAPVRLLDTRPGYQAINTPGVPVAQGAPLDLEVGPVAGVPIGAGSVVLNVTAVSPNLPGNLKVYPSDASAPSVSNVNFVAGQVVPNLVTVALSKASPGPQGHIKVAIDGWTGVSSDVVIDIAGYYVGGTGLPATQAAGTFVPLTPFRIYDTRGGDGAQPTPGGDVAIPSSAGSNGVDWQMAGLNGIDLTATAIVLNVTATQEAGPGYVAIRPGGSTGTPSVSNVNYVANQDVPNAVTVPLGTGAAAGKINIWTVASTHLIIDVAGYYTSGTPTVNGAFVPVSPTRILDTRDPANQGVPVPDANQTNLVGIDGATPAGGGAPVLPADGVAAVVMNMTVTNPDAPGHLTVFPSDLSSPPNSSNLNYVAGQTVPNLTIPKVGTDGAVGIFTQGANTDVIADVAGYFIGPKWNFTAAASPVGATGSSISCVSATFCAAIGSGGASVFTGASWSAATAGSFGTEVSCASPTFCMTNTGMKYNGASWAAGPALPISATYVSCPTTTFCMATSSTWGGPNDYATFNGTAWTAATDSPAGGTTSLQSGQVSCPDSMNCFVGVLGGSIRQWNVNGGWATKGPATVPIDNVTDISCATSIDCVAVSTRATAFWDGISWSVNQFDPASNRPAPTAVSCANAASVMCAIVDGQGFFDPENAPTRQLGLGGLADISCPTPNFCGVISSTGSVSTGTYS